MDVDEVDISIEGDAAGAGAGALERAGADDSERTVSLPWVEKYRPSSLDDLIAHEEIINTINRLISANKLPHLLFYGPPGTGKTSTILACARQLYGPKFQAMTLELNASDDRGINVVRNQIKSFAGTQKLFSTGVKLVILDEADAMSADAQFALRRVIEKYTKNTRFCLICNYVSKIIPALQSRCTRFRFAPLKQAQISGRLDSIVEAEKVPTTPDGLKAILRLSNGDMRKVLNILQSTAMAHDVVSEESVYQCTGEPLPSDIEAILGKLLNNTFKEGFDFVTMMQREKGLALADVVTRIATLVAAMELPSHVLVFLLARLADVEHRLTKGTSERIQLASTIATFHRARKLMMTPP